VAIAFHLRVLLHEEPWLTRRHGEAYVAYKAKVPRWLV
jgi:protein-S-isoprenylcysteine O-methyltransferase Ste14